jgi:hypothetical protein
VDIMLCYYYYFIFFVWVKCFLCKVNILMKSVKIRVFIDFWGLSWEDHFSWNLWFWRDFMEFYKIFCNIFHKFYNFLWVLNDFSEAFGEKSNFCEKLKKVVKFRQNLVKNRVNFGVFFEGFWGFRGSRKTSFLAKIGVWEMDWTWA